MSILRDNIIENIQLLKKIADLTDFLHTLTKEQISKEKIHFDKAVTGLASLTILLATFSKEKT